MVDIQKISRQSVPIINTPRVDASTVSAAPRNAGQGFSALADTLARINDRMQDRLDLQAQADGVRAGRVAGANGVPQLMDETTIRGAAYNRSARDSVMTQFELRTREFLHDTEQKYKNDPVRFNNSATTYINGIAEQLQGFDPGIAQEVAANFTLRKNTAITRIQDRADAIVRDRQTEDALRLQMNIQNDLQDQALELFTADPADVRGILETMTASSAQLADVGSRVGPSGRPLFSARERIAFEQSAEDLVSGAVGTAWLQQQADPIAGYHAWKNGTADFEVAGEDGQVVRVPLRDVLPPRMYADVQKNFMENLRADLSLRNQIENYRDAQAEDLSDAVYTEMARTAQDRPLSLPEVEAARDVLSPEKYLTLRSLAKTGGASVDEGAAVNRLTVLDAQGADIRGDLSAAYVDGQLTQDTYLKLYDRNAARIDKGVTNAVQTGRDYVGNSLGRLSSELGFAQSISIAPAEAEYEVRVQDFVAEKGRQPTHNEALDIGRDVVRRYGALDIQNTIQTMPLPRFISAAEKFNRDFSSDTVKDAARKTRDFFLKKHGGDVDRMKEDEEYQAEAELLQEYIELLTRKEGQNDQ